MNASGNGAAEAGATDIVMGAQERALVERPITFDYEMRCECGATTHMSATDYAEQVGDAHIACADCDQRIHYGSAVIALRDPNDLKLNDAAVTSTAWYHTSTWNDWPSASFFRQSARDLKAACRRLGLNYQLMRHGQPRTVVHLGSYEAALENMLRRMRNQADGASQFYLYRVRLRNDLRINRGYRDENGTAEGIGDFQNG